MAAFEALLERWPVPADREARRKRGEERGCSAAAATVERLCASQ